MVHIIQVGGDTKAVAYTAGATIASVLSRASINAEGFEIKYNGVRVADNNQAVNEDGTIILTRRVKGA